MLAADFMSAAIQITPSSPTVFEAAGHLSELAAKSPTKADRQVVRKLVGQIEEMLPCQPIAKLEQCRRRYHVISKTLNKSQRGDFLSAKVVLRRMAVADMPPSVRAVLLGAALARLQQRGLVTLTNHYTESPLEWQDWWNRYRQLKIARHQALAAGRRGWQGDEEPGGRF